jgi:transcription antitermination factor NusG
MAGTSNCGEWFAMQTRPNFELTVSRAIERKGFDAFVPTYKEPRSWSDRVKMLDLPLFPGYVFWRPDAGRMLPPLTTPGVRSIVSFGRVPAPIPDSEIESVRRFISSDLNVKPWPFLRVGQTVRFEKGPLAGLDGILEEFKGTYRLVVSISLLQRSIAAEVDGSWVRPVS